MSSRVLTTSGSTTEVLPVAVRRLLYGALLLLLGLLVALESANTSGLPIAALIALLIVYAALCIVRLEAAMAVTLAMTPFSLEMSFGSGALQIPTEPMLFLALTAWLWRFLLRGSTTVRQPTLLLLLLVALATSLLSIVDSAHRLAALKAVMSASWYALFGIFLLNNFDREDRLRRLGVALILPGLLLTLMSLIRVGLGEYDRAAGLWAAWPFFTEHGSFAAYLSFVLALCVGLTLESRGGTRFLYGVGAAMIGLQVVLSMTRGAWLGLAGFFLFVLALEWRRFLRPTYLLVLLLALGGIVTGLAATGVLDRLEIYTRVTSQGNYTSNLERVNRWYAGLRMFQSDPLTGVGYGTYPDLYHRFRRIPVATDQSAMRMGIHNEYLKVLVETGIVGALSALGVALCVTLLAVRTLRRSSPGMPRALAVGWAGGLLTYAIHAAVNNFLAYDKVAMPLWTAIGGLAALDLLNRNAADRTKPNP